MSLLSIKLDGLGDGFVVSRYRAQRSAESGRASRYGLPCLRISTGTVTGEKENNTQCAPKKGQRGRGETLQAPASLTIISNVRVLDTQCTNRETQIQYSALSQSQKGGPTSAEKRGAPVHEVTVDSRTWCSCCSQL